MEIQSLRRLIRQGRYEVPPERVAEAIIQWIDPLALHQDRGRAGTPTPTDLGSEPRGLFDRPPHQP